MAVEPDEEFRYRWSVDFDEAADRLYGLVPEEFTTARDALAKEARTGGDAALAKRLKALRKPTLVAWAINQASRREGELDPLLDLGRRLREAWQAQDADALTEAGRERTPLISRLTRAVREAAEAAGHPLSPSADLEIEQTLDAAVVDEDAADQVRRGRLTRPLSYSGFTPAPVVRPAAARTAKAETKPRAAKGGAKTVTAPSEGERGAEREAGRRAAEEEREKARKAERERRITELENALAEAEQAAQEAERGRADWESERADAESERERRAAKVETLTAKLAKAKDKLNAATHRLDVARREETNAGRAARSARVRVDEARAALDRARSVDE